MSTIGMYSPVQVVTKVLVSFFISTSIITLVLLPLFFMYLNGVQSSYFVDERFHIPQAIRYCQGKFSEWDDKITTLPGLYLFSYLWLAPWNLCQIIYLRCTNLICTYINFFLILKLVKYTEKLTGKDSTTDWWKGFLTASNITFFPPLFFWFFLYYTDVLSVTTVLLMIWFHLKQNRLLAAISGAAAVLVRQTSIVWVGLLALDEGLQVISRIAEYPQIYYVEDIKAAYDNMKIQSKKGYLSFFKFITRSCIPIFPYATVILSFLAFVIYNKGIVVGDRSAHAITFHSPQILYFTVFTFVFAWPYMLSHVKGFFKFIYKNRTITRIAFCLILAAIHYNTMVHPYILADNRHYSFYIWKNFMNRYDNNFKYLMTPVYGFTIYAFLSCTEDEKPFIRQSYFACVIALLVPQLLLEPRYFIIPYLFFRLSLKNVATWQIVAESCTVLIINIAQFYLFINKTFYWEDLEDPQRIAW